MTPEELAAQAAAAKATADAKAKADADAAAKAKTDEWKPPSKEEWEKVQGALKERNTEAAANRKAADEAKAKADTAEKEKLEKAGEFKSLFEKERADREKLASRVAELEPYEGTVKEEVATLTKKLGDKAPPVDGLSDAHKLRLLRYADSQSAGPGAVRQTTSGVPKPVTTTVLPDIENLTQEEIMALPKEARDALYAHHFPGKVRRTNAF